jgi:hypothetical protein
MWGVILLAGYLLWRQAAGQGRQREIEQAIQARRLDPQTLPRDPGARALLRQHLKSPYPGEVIYALELLSQADSATAQQALPDLLSHPHPQVRQEALLRLEKSLQDIDPRLIYILAEADDSAEVREVALRVYCRYAPLEEVLARVPALLDDPNPAVIRGAVVGLLENGGGPGLEQGEQVLLGLTQSPHPEKRQVAAQILGEVENKRFSSYLLQLLNDGELEVQRAAILAAGRLNYPLFWSYVISKLGEPALGSAAASALFMANKTIYPSLEMAFNQPMPNRPLMMAIARVCGQRRDSQAQDLLRAQMQHPERAVRYQVWRSLSICQYQAGGEAARQEVHSLILQETAGVQALGEILRDLAGQAAYADLLGAIEQEVQAGQDRVWLLLGFLYPPKSLSGLEKIPPAKWGRLLSDLPRPMIAALELSLGAKPSGPAKGPAEGPLLRLLEEGPIAFTPWIRALALFSIQPAALSPALLDQYLESFEPLLRETALWKLHQSDPAAFAGQHLPLWRDQKPYLVPLAEAMAGQGENMLLLLEKVLILKSLGIFGRVPDGILVELANLVQEVDLAAGEVLFEQHNPGNTMYIIVRGRLQVIADGRVIAERHDREFIGEMALFDEEPRSATAKALQTTKLLQVDRRAFGELLASHPEVAMSVLKVLSQRLREMMKTQPDTTELYEQNLPATA